MRYIQDMEACVQQVRSWANKYRICDDRKKNREKALTDFNKAHIAYSKKAQTSQKPEEIQRFKQSADIAFSFLESQNQSLVDLIDELSRDKHEVLNKIVIDYMMKSHMFHKKAN